ncbi:hypothetical protein TCAL_11558 [Tigriopus californicus]|uniref:Reverse transcriptase domain-containing protein n=1 Tax=Tigriopus californicus TaxID=6832 RepID=A0A553PEU8_TIGCA|nr:hypothetical protein TCAL_11558 [Tigriopus californicus]|eukprot:TCALIF_11558-PA protein Name:"Similar to pol RNA-directed DNA polymerase from mobile element jockey (Drosophila melanogaster)" AED:0.24 eAED:0.24 QI:0/-1/0/1/-1/1/1/0/157
MEANDQIVSYSEEAKLFPQSQHGYRKHRTTTSALHCLQAKVMEFKEMGYKVTLANFDPSSAHNCLDREIPDGKLQSLRFDETSRRWIKSYLSNRRLSIRVGTALSNMMPVSFGTVQGSALSQTLFLLYISDIELWTNFSLSCYCDDTCAIVKAESQD